MKYFPHMNKKSILIELLFLLVLISFRSVLNKNSYSKFFRNISISFYLRNTGFGFSQKSFTSNLYNLNYSGYTKLHCLNSFIKLK